MRFLIKDCTCLVRMRSDEIRDDLDIFAIKDKIESQRKLDATYKENARRKDY
jgi:hypothetical protein